MAQVGDTVKLKAKFHGWAGTPVNLDNNATLKVYNKEQEQLEEVTLGISNPNTGEYHYEYTIPEDYGYGYITYEYSGEIGGASAKRRKRMKVTWDE